MPYGLHKYNRNIFDLLKCISMDFCIWSLVLYLEGEAQDAALEIPEDEIAEKSGADSILHSLGRLFKKDFIITKYQPLKAFETFKHPCDMLIQPFLNES